MRGEKRVYFVRHGQSEDNGHPIYQREEAPLSELGHQQAETIAARVANLPVKPEALIVSSLLRTRQTAEPIIQATGLEPIYSNLFVERIKPSSIDGKPFSDEAATATYHEWKDSLYTPGKKVEDGENFDETKVRVVKQLEYLKNRPESVLMVVSHGVNIRNILAWALLGKSFNGESLRHFQEATETQNTGVTVLDYFENAPHWRMWTYNDHGHLDE